MAFINHYVFYVFCQYDCYVPNSFIIIVFSPISKPKPSSNQPLRIADSCSENINHTSSKKIFMPEDKHY